MNLFSLLLLCGLLGRAGAAGVAFGFVCPEARDPVGCPRFTAGVAAAFGAANAAGGVWVRPLA